VLAVLAARPIEAVTETVTARVSSAEVSSTGSGSMLASREVTIVVIESHRASIKATRMHPTGQTIPTQQGWQFATYQGMLAALRASGL